jgi:hypothetical protein
MANLLVHQGDSEERQENVKDHGAEVGLESSQYGITSFAVLIYGCSRASRSRVVF